MAMFAPYNFFGILNMFDICPDFVFPIFERNGIYFFEDVNEDTGKIKDFIPVKQDAIYLIKSSKNFKLSKTLDSSFSIGSLALIAFQLSDSYLRIGTISELKSFLLTYETEDKILNDEIQAFFEEFSKI